MRIVEPLARFAGFRTPARRGLAALPPLALALALTGCGGESTPPDTTPRVSGVVPGDGSINVSTDVVLHVSFARDMDPSSITESTFKLASDSGDVSGAVTASTTSATFTPSGLLGAQTLFTATLTTGVKDAASAALPSAYSWSFTTGNPINLTPPQVVSMAPLAAAQLVPFNTTVSATFSKAITSNTVTNTSFTLKADGVAISAVVSAAGTTATLAPLTQLAPETSYTATLTQDIKDTVGLALDHETSWSFTTGPAPDLTPPSIVTTLPLTTSIAQPTSTGIYIVFSEPMSGTSISGTTLKLKKGTSIVAGEVTLASNVARFLPTAALAPNANFTFTVKKDVADVAGNKLFGGADVTLTFSTGAALDTSAPAFAESAPAAGETTVPPNRPLIARFTEGLSPASVNSTTFAITSGGGPVAGAYAFAGSSVVFRPTAPWTDGAEVQVALSTGLLDASGNALAVAQAFTFTAGSVKDDTDTTAPAVISVVPDTLAFDVSTRPTVTLTFSEAISPLTLSLLNFALADPSGTPVGGDLAATLNTVTFTPRGPLAYQTVYTVTLTTDVLDLSGNALAAPFGSTFTTRGLPDVQINELLAGPSTGPAGDSNGDELTDSGDDEFVELINSSASDQDLSGWTLRTGKSLATVADKFTFPVGATLAAGGRAVVFGGGAPADFGAALVFKATSSLSLTNTGATVVLQARPEQLADTVTYTGLPGNGASWVKSPEGVKSAPLVDHTTLSGNAGVLWSPGVSSTQTVPRVHRQAGQPKASSEGAVPSQPVLVQFNTAMLPEELAPTFIKLHALPEGSTDCTAATEANLVASTITATVDGTQAVLTPEANLANNTLHCVRVLQGLHTGATGGAALAAEVAYTFTTGVFVPAQNVRINEFLARPAGAASNPLPCNLAALGDANGDGTTGSTADEFIELLNNEATDVDLSGWKLTVGASGSPSTKFVFPAATTLVAGGRAVIFGGGQPTGSFGTDTHVYHASLGLTDSGRVLRLERTDTMEIDKVSYGTGELIPSQSGTCESQTRDPEGVGAFVKHTAVSTTGTFGVLWSPGVASTAALPKVNSVASLAASAAAASAKSGDFFVQFNMAMLAEDLTAANIKLYASGCTTPVNEVSAGLSVGPSPVRGPGAAAFVDQATLNIAGAFPLTASTLHCMQIAGTVRSATASGSTLSASASYEFTTGP